MKNMKKQDRQGVRTPADLERKYDLSGLGGGNIDMTKIRLEVSDMIGDMTSDMQESINRRIDAVTEETDQKIAAAIADFVKTSDYDSYKESINAILDQHTQNITVILKDIETATRERASITQAVDALSKSVTDLSAELDALAQGGGGNGSIYIGSGEMPDGCNVQIDVKADPSNHPSCIVLPVGTDLDTVTGLNRYVSETVSGDNYAHCPTTSGTFHLLVESCGNTGQIIQRLTYSNKTKGKTWERVFYNGTWGEWIRVTDYGGTLLWEGVWYMNASHTVNLSEAVSKQKNGIVLVFSEYSGGELNTAFQTFFIPKMQVSMFPSGARYSFMLTTSKFGYVGTKDLTITDTQITGSADNTATGTGTAGITFTNNRFCLRHVIGV